jgi:hypothetical protein
MVTDYNRKKSHPSTLQAPGAIIAAISEILKPSSGLSHCLLNLRWPDKPQKQQAQKQPPKHEGLGTERKQQ